MSNAVVLPCPVCKKTPESVGTVLQTKNDHITLSGFICRTKSCSFKNTFVTSTAWNDLPRIRPNAFELIKYLVEVFAECQVLESAGSEGEALEASLTKVDYVLKQIAGSMCSQLDYKEMAVHLDEMRSIDPGILTEDAILSYVMSTAPASVSLAPAKTKGFKAGEIAPSDVHFIVDQIPVKYGHIDSTKVANPPNLKEGWEPGDPKFLGKMTPAPPTKHVEQTAATKQMKYELPGAYTAITHSKLEEQYNSELEKQYKEKYLETEWSVLSNEEDYDKYGDFPLADVHDEKLVTIKTAKGVKGKIAEALGSVHWTHQKPQQDQLQTYMKVSEQEYNAVKKTYMTGEKAEIHKPTPGEVALYGKPVVSNSEEPFNQMQDLSVEWSVLNSENDYDK